MTIPASLTVVVDAANCVGSVPDGWWRDRIAATERLRDSITVEGLRRVLHVDVNPQIVLIVEGRARGVESSAEVRVVDAPGNGDDMIVHVVEELAAQQKETVVVTADRGLRTRVAGLGARVVGPKAVRSR